MRFKKALSVFMAALMLFSVMSLGITAAADEIDYAAQYEMLADALKNEHVRELTNYKVVNSKLENSTEGFDQEAKGFAYDHTVVAEDNYSSDILKASNRYYYIAESLMSFQYGVGCYDAATLVEYISDKIKPYFEKDGGVLYEDFYGNRYEPTEEEIEAYNKAVEEILAAGMEIDKINLPTYGIQFIEKSVWEYYNVDTILRYFMGNSVSVNAGNYYHRFSFVVQTSMNVFLEDCGGIDYIPYAKVVIRTAAYQFAYQRFYNETASKAYYAFAEPSLERVWNSYGIDYGFSKTPENLSLTYDGVTRGGQASYYLIKTEEDTTTVPMLRTAYEQFMYFINEEYSDFDESRWDAIFSSMTDDQIDNPEAFVKNSGIVNTNGMDSGQIASEYNARVSEITAAIKGVRTYGAQIFSDTFSNAALVGTFGNDLGNMVTLYYLLKKTSEDPTRIVRGNASYTADGEAVTDILQDIDALISPRDGEEGDGDTAIANRVATVLTQLLDIGGLLGVEGELEYETLGDLVGMVLSELVFTDSIVNMLVELLYPMIVELLVDNIGSIEVVGGLLGDIIDSVLEDNDLAIYPNVVATRLEEDYGSKYSYAASVLRNAGGSWENVNFEALSWGVDDAPADQKAEAFLDALCAGLSGFTRVLVVFLCGDYEYQNDERGSLKNANFGKYYDLELIGGTYFTSVGAYTKVFIPLYRVLGIPEEFYLTSKDFHAAVDNNINDCLRKAVEPILKWATECVAKKPLQTVMSLVPNLVHFLSRTDEAAKAALVEHKENWGKAYVILTDNQANAHKGFSLVQTLSLVDILDHVCLNLSIGGTIPVSIGSLKKLIGGSTMDMLSSLNGLLNEVISFSYETDVITGYNIVCYSDNLGNIVFPDSEEYGLYPDNYPNGHLAYYSDEEHTIFSLTQDEAHPVKHESPIYHEEPFSIPAIPEGKLISTGTVTTQNTINVKEPGKVFVFLLRYVLSAVGYKYDSTLTDLPSVIECLGLDLSGELFLGLGLGDIVNNVMLHPDAAICALLELFYSGETGDLYLNKPYTYPLEPINYHETTLLNTTINPTLSYGSNVRYSQYWTKENADNFIANLTPLAEDVLMMLDIEGLEGLEDGLGAFLRNLVNDMLFTDDLVNTVFNLIYQLLGGLNDTIGFDIEAVLKSVLDVDFSTKKIADSLEKIVGRTPAWERISAVSSWTELFMISEEYDPETGELVPVIDDVELAWGVTDPSIIENPAEQNFTSGKVFLKTLATLLSPAAFLIKFLFMDQDLSILGLINLPGYAGYQYAFIGLLEALSCPNILTYRDYYEAAQDPVCGDANTIYYLFSPILSLLEKAYSDPLNVVLSLIPNLLFFISIGGFNGLLNNLVHFVYVLLDILKPILNGYDLVDGLLANLEIEGLTLKLSLPLDVDFNALVSDLVGSLLGDSLTIEGVSISLPYIDLYTLCVGTLQRFNSKEVRPTVFLNATGGGDLLTAILRVALEILYMEENHEALGQIVVNLVGEGKLDEYDAETMFILINTILGMIEEYEVIDIVLFGVYTLITMLLPIADTLSERLVANGMTINDIIDSAGNTDDLIAVLGKLLEDPNKIPPPDHVEDGDAIMSLFDKIKQFFEKIKLFFQRLFNFG